MVKLWTHRDAFPGAGICPLSWTPSCAVPYICCRYLLPAGRVELRRDATNLELELGAGKLREL